MRTLTLISVVALCALAAGGCGDDDDDDSGGGGSSAEQTGGGNGGGGSGSGGGGGAQTLKLSADPGGALKFDKSSLTAKSGKVTVVMDNPSDLPHAVEVEGQGVEKAGETVGNGGVSKVTADLKPGEYEFYCPVDGHKQAGMEGELTVN